MHIKKFRMNMLLPFNLNKERACSPETLKPTFPTTLCHTEGHNISLHFLENSIYVNIPYICFCIQLNVLVWRKEYKVPCT